MKNRLFTRTIVFLLSFILGMNSGWAIIRTEHAHEDLFAEGDLWLGFKLGPQITRYTALQQGSTIIPVQGSARVMVGPTIKFVYSFPRLELNFLWSTRGGLNTADSLQGVATPVLLKLPIVIGDLIDLEFGAGVQPDIIFFGPEPRRKVLWGTLATLGISVDFLEYIFEFEVRYNIGLKALTDPFLGGVPRDLNILGGLMWRF